MQDLHRGLQGSAKPCTHKSLYFKHGLFATVHILHRMCKLVKVSPKPAHKRAFLLIDQPNCGGSPAKPERGRRAQRANHQNAFHVI